MPLFSIPIVYTTIGYLRVEATSIEAVKIIAKQLDEEGINYFALEDSSSSSECQIDEIAEID